MYLKRKIVGRGRRIYVPPLVGAGKKRLHGKGSRIYAPPLVGAGRNTTKNPRMPTRYIRTHHKRQRGKFLPFLPLIMGALPFIGKAIAAGAISGGVGVGISKLAK